MGGNFKKGTKIISENGIEYEIIDYIGEGGQGKVFKVKSGKDELALKWYFPNWATKDQKKILDQLIIKGAPSPNYLWPKDIIEMGDRFGYIMDLRPASYNSLLDWMKRKVTPTFRTLCVSGFNIAREYRILHAQGWCYRDISWGNVFIDFKTGDVLICDNDNVTINKSDIGTIGGTLGFMAPEIVIGTAKPSTNTDLFSLAVLLFYLFNIHHPLHGKLEANIKALDPIAMKKIYGTSPVFIWDPKNDSNRPVRIYQQNAIDFWKIYPSFLKEIFIKAFTVGLDQPHIRSTEVEWQDVCIRLLDSIVDCPNSKCGVENFYDLEKEKNGIVNKCWSCQKPLPTPPFLRIGKDVIVLSRKTKLFQHHAKNDLNIGQVIGEVVQNPKDPGRWGIKNLSNEIWVFAKPNGESVLVEHGKALPLIKGGMINFGINKGEIN